MPGAALDRPAPFAERLADLAAAHRMAWLAQVLPPGPCLVWAGGPSLAAALAGDGSRTVLLLEPTARGAERALAEGAPGVTVRHAPDVASSPALDGAGFASLVVVLAPDDDPRRLLPPLVERSHQRGAIAVVDRHGRWQAALDVLRGLGRAPDVVHQAVRTASCIAVADDPVTATPETSLAPDASDAVLLVDGLSPDPSVLLGDAAGPPAWTQSADEAVAALRRFDEQVRTEQIARIRELEAALAAADAERAAAQHVADDRGLQIDALLSSTSWRISAPARWASDVVASLRGGRRTP
jgi:hypothetical protein